MDWETETHDLPSCSAAANLWNYETSYWSSSNSKGEYVPKNTMQMWIFHHKQSENATN